MMEYNSYKSDSKLSLFSDGLQQDLQTFPVDPQHFGEVLPFFAQLLPEGAAFVQCLHHSPAELDLALGLHHESEVGFQFVDVRGVQEGKGALEVGWRYLLEQLQKEGGLLVLLECFDDLLSVLQVLVPCLDLSVLELFIGVFFDHHLIHVLFLLVSRDSLIVGLLPNPKTAVESTCDDVVSSCGHSQRSNFQNVFLEIHDELMRVSIPKLDMSVLASSYHVVSLIQELDSSDWLSMREDGLDRMSEIEVPETDVLVNTAGDEQGIIGGDVEGVDGQFVSVELKAVLVGVGVLDVDL